MPHRDPIFRQERIELDFKDVGLHGSVPHLGRIHTFKARQWDAMDKHGDTHEGVMEVHYIASGSQLWRIAGKEYHTRGGDMFVALPGEEHIVGEHIQERILIYWIRLRLPRKDKGGKFLNFPKKIVSPMLDELSEISPESRMFKAPMWIQHLFDEVILADAHAKANMKPLAVSLALLNLLMDIVPCIEAGQVERRGETRKTRDIARVLKYIDEHLLDGFEVVALLSNDELASQANLSRAGFQAKFHQQTGISPAEYVRHRKIERAIDLLSPGRRSVTEVAMLLGFSSSQYFAKVFKKYTNKHPSDYLS